ncbi:MAG: hypothetical protein GX025_08575, partial [Clostridiales bacterium]|nr:hypothetical protein [Clostridiales bacterium]
MENSGIGLSIDDAGLLLYGENIARTLNISSVVKGGSIAKNIYKSLRSLQRQHRLLEQKYAKGENIPAFSEWLLDNNYLAVREGLSAASDLRQIKKLPASGGQAALFLLCRSLIQSGDGRLTQRRIELFMEGCQSVYVLSRRELSLLIPCLKLAVIVELSELYSKGSADESCSLSAERLFSSLRALATLDFTELLRSIDKTESLFKTDPSGIYPLMSEKTCENYKRKLEKLAKSLHINEHHLAEHILRLARGAQGEASHIGHYLFTNPLGENKPIRNGSLYISSLLTFTLFISLFAGFALKSIPAVLLLILPVYELIKSLMDFVLLRITPPTHIPRMELSQGVPPEGRTICTICALLTGADSGKTLARRLEEYRLASRDCGENLLFAILADLPDNKEPSAEYDEEYISSCERAISALNEKYGGGFFLFTRKRSYNKADSLYTAKERKRGAICQLSRLLQGNDSEILCLSGSLLSLRGVRYILTLDEDTRLTSGTARELIGAMLHPLNKPEVDRENKLVKSGYGLIHPRISTGLPAYNASRFARCYAGAGGIDPYGSDSSELYMDIFDNGGFAGKGIIDVSAFVSCLDSRFPENTILSHDALEGAYLRGGYMGDAELSDGFPSEPLSYFRRMHRWTRGDWQNSPWIFRRGRKLSDVDRFRLFDSLRRSMAAPLFLLALLAAFFFSGKAMNTVALLTLLALCLRLVTSSVSALFQNARQAEVRCHSGVLHGVGAALVQSVLKLMFLPYEAYICISAIITALWRLLISHKRLLEWTPSSVLERGGKGKLRFFINLWPSLVIGLACLFFAPSIIGKATGFVWLLSPLAAIDLSKKLSGEKDISPQDKSYLIQTAKKFWSFFEDFCTATDHFLPPDNWQEQPPVGIAHRTSPTNIGLCLICCLSAIDLNLCPKENALGLAENILSTLRRMPKWKGHLYNWYDTRTLKPLRPAYVSTVDSGNLAACLIILREGLLECGSEALARQCDELLSPMSFLPLYDESRHLFSIGYDTDKNELSGSYYDLMASEARTASYLAIASGELPRRHWRRLSRALTEYKGFRGMVSWTGSMFEYLMPRLFFKSQPCSLMYESMKFCIGVQKERTKKLKLPWGISESAFFSLDPALNYRYKAHGCAALALKREMNTELVVSPYSSFLTLPCGVKPAIKNLKDLEKRGAGCKYGFWEAIDFTAERSEKRCGEIVRCVMAHHLGMSLVAISNTLCKDSMPQRLMRDPAISAHSCLLDEKLPIGGPIMRRKEQKAPEKPQRSSGIYWERRGEFTDFLAPECCVLSNGSYNVMLTDSGLTRPSFKGISPYLSQSDTLTNRHGIDLYLIRGDELIPLLPEPNMDDSIKTDWEFTFSGAKINTVRKDFRSQVIYSVSSTANGEKRVISLSAFNKDEQNCQLLIMLEPVMLSMDDYVNHPAFCKLGMHAKMRAGTLILKRLARGRHPERYMCLAASEPIEASADRSLVPGRGGLLDAVKNNLPSKLGWLSDPMLCAKLPIRISEGCDSAVTIVLTIGDTENGAYNDACRMLTGDAANVSPFPAETAARLKLTEAETQDAMELLSTISYPEIKKSTSRYTKSSLWKFGISGDLPIISYEVKTEDDLLDAEELIKQQAFLSCLGQHFDLAFITAEGGDYLRPLTDSLCRFKAKVTQCGQNIHILDASQGIDAVLHASYQPRQRAFTKPDINLMSTSPISKLSNDVEYEWLDDNSFRFYVNHSLPTRSWGNMLTNGSFGFFASDCGTGHMWYKNAREYPINSWLCDSLTTAGTETLQVLADAPVSLFASPDDDCCSVTYGFGFSRWNKVINGISFKTTAFVPPDTDARVLIVTWEDEDEREILWYTDLVLGSNHTSISVKEKDGIFTASSLGAPFNNADFHVCAGKMPNSYTTSRPQWLQGEEENNLEYGECLGLRFKAKSPFILVCGCDEPSKLLSLCETDTALHTLKNTVEGWKSSMSAIKINTPNKALDRLVNGWLLYQTLACRIMGRCSLYQSGGAFGFRDQLQDAVNLILFDEAPAKYQIIESCRHQYLEGDVMHWWHILDTGTKGVRTRCSDDLVWLPWALCEYVEKTGDESILSISVPWLCSPPLEETEQDRYETAVPSDEHSSVLSHAQKALDMVMSRGTGEHGLLKILGGDWNDGMSHVGAAGKGESVWLTWFFSHTAQRFSELLKNLGKNDGAEKYEKAAKELGNAANSAWDGSWYLRGYYDDGSPLGSSESDACRIDSVSQSFSALSPYANKLYVSLALTAAVDRLYEPENKLLRLFEPPFENSSKNPGYIQSYGPGFRENGGQYTHAAIWLIMALIKESRQDEALELIETLIPENHPITKYEAEPYVIAADVYANPDCMGRAGWSWYTASSRWLLRVICEHLLGLKL